MNTDSTLSIITEGRSGGGKLKTTHNSIVSQALLDLVSNSNSNSNSNKGKASVTVTSKVGANSTSNSDTTRILSTMNSNGSNSGSGSPSSRSTNSNSGSSIVSNDDLKESLSFRSSSNGKPRRQNLQQPQQPKRGRSSPSSSATRDDGQLGKIKAAGTKRSFATISGADSGDSAKASEAFAAELRQQQPSSKRVSRSPSAAGSKSKQQQQEKDKSSKSNNNNKTNKKDSGAKKNEAESLKEELEWANAPTLKRKRMPGKHQKGMVPPGRKGMATYCDRDVLCGRGSASNLHIGNRYFRNVIDQYRAMYLRAKKNDKPLISREVVRIIRDRGGRFLKQDERSGYWFEIGDVLARDKVSQQMRHNAQQVREELDRKEQQEQQLLRQQKLMSIAVQRQQQEQQHQQQQQQQQNALLAAELRLFNHQKLAAAGFAVMPTRPTAPLVMMDPRAASAAAVPSAAVPPQLLSPGSAEYLMAARGMGMGMPRPAAGSHLSQHALGFRGLHGMVASQGAAQNAAAAAMMQPSALVAPGMLPQHAAQLLHEHSLLSSSMTPTPATSSAAVHSNSTIAAHLRAAAANGGPNIF